MAKSKGKKNEGEPKKKAKAKRGRSGPGLLDRLTGLVLVLFLVALAMARM